MEKSLIYVAAGFVLGLYVGYHKEEEIDDLCRQSKKAKKRMKKKYHKTMDHICDCMDMD